MADTERIINVKNTFLHLSLAPEENLSPNQRRSQSLPPRIRETHDLQDFAEPGSALVEDTPTAPKDAKPSWVLIAGCPIEPNDRGIHEKPIFEQAPPMQQGLLLHDSPCTTSYNSVAEGDSQVPSDDDDFAAFDAYNCYPKTNWFEQAAAMQQAPEVSTVLEKVQTVIMYNIPFQATQQQVIKVINQHGFAGTYDFLHMPVSNGGKCKDSGDAMKKSHHLGFAFINFLTPESAPNFLKIFQNFCFPDCNSSKLTGSKPSAVQGYRANVEASKKCVKQPRRGKRK